MAVLGLGVSDTQVDELRVKSVAAEALLAEARRNLREALTSGSEVAERVSSTSSGVSGVPDFVAPLKKRRRPPNRLILNPPFASIT